MTQSKLTFKRVIRLDHQGRLGDYLESNYFLFNTNQLFSVEDFLMPIMFDGTEADRPKTQLNFVNGDKIIVRGVASDISESIEQKRYQEDLNLPNV